MNSKDLGGSNIFPLEEKYFPSKEDNIFLLGKNYYFPAGKNEFSKNIFLARKREISAISTSADCGDPENKAQRIFKKKRADCLKTF